MARNDIYVNINASSPADAIVTAQQDMTAATIPELVLGDTPTFNFRFTDNTNVWPSWAGNASYTLTWALSDAVGGDFAPASTTSTATPITGGWSVTLPLNSYDLVGLMNQKRFSQAYPVTNLWQQLRVADPSGNEVTRAMFWTPVRYRAISDTQNTESASPTGGRVITTLVSNALQSPTAAQFYAANPVPTSALGTGSNGQLFIGNGSGFVKSTLTAGTGITITNAAGAITIDATTTGGNVGLNDGTAAAPSLYFLNDTNTGLYRVGADSIGVAVNGAQLAYFDANGITVPSAGVVAGGSLHAANGNANNPSHSFSSDQDTGLFRHQPNEIGIALGGVQTGTLTAALATLTSRLSLSSGATTSALTDLLINPTTKASGNLIDAQVGGTSKFKVAYNGVTTLGANGSNAADLYFSSALSGAQYDARMVMSGYGLNITALDLFINASYSFHLKSNNTLVASLTSSTFTISPTTASTSTTTGALVVSGGVGVAGKIYTGDTIVAGGSSGGFLTINRTSLSGAYLIYSQNGELAFYEQATSANKLTIAASTGNVSVLSTTDTTGAGTGALQVSGGAYVAKDIYVGSARIKAAGTYSIMLGSTANSIIGDGHFAAGDNAQITAAHRAVAIGCEVTASGTFGTAMGMRSEAYRAMWAYANGYFSSRGDSQATLCVVYGKTTTNTAVELTNFGQWYSGGTRVTIPSGRVLSCLINCQGVKSDGSAVASYIRRVSIKNVGGTTSLVAAAEAIGTDIAAGTSIAISADDTNDSLKIEVTGVASETWRWTARIDSTETVYGT